MAATRDVRTAAAAPWHNRNLFSDHFLATGAREHPEWLEAVDGAWDFALELFTATRDQLPRLNEAQTEEEWVRPVLAHVLGWSYSVQPDAPLFGRRNRPDYLLFATQAGIKPPQLDEFYSVAEAPLRAAELAALGWTEETVWGGGPPTR